MRKPTPEEAEAIEQALWEHAVHELVVESCREQGLPIKITDPTVIRQVAVLFNGGGRGTRRGPAA